MQQVTVGFKAAIYINSFLLGASVLSLEMLGSRYLNPYFGSSLYVWASLISTVLVAIALGALIGGAVADKAPNLFVLGGIIAVGAAYIGLIPVFFGDAVKFIAEGISDLAAGSLVASFALLFFPLLLLSVYTPFAIRLILHNSSASGTISGRISAVSTFGNIFGTLFTSFVLIPSFGSKLITYCLAGIIGLCALSIILTQLLSGGKKAGAVAKVVAMGLLLSIFFISPSYAEEKALTVKEILAKSDGLVESAESQYNNIYLYKEGNYISMKFNLMGRDYIQSTMNVNNPLELPHYYARLMIAPFYYLDNPKDVLLVGLGGGTVMRYIQHYIPSLNVTEIEIDKGVIRMAKKWFGITESPNHKIVENDGRMYLSRSPATYDIIMVDAFQGSSIPFHLLTQEYYKLLLSRLKTGGAIVFNFHANSELFDSSMVTVKTVFQNVDVYYAEGNAVVVAYQGKKLTKDELSKRSAAFGVKYKPLYNMKDIFGCLTEMEYNKSSPLLTDDYAPVEYLNVKKRETK